MNSDPGLAPFSCTYTSHVPEILHRLKCTIAITTYQAGKLVLISAKDENTIIQLPRTFDKPMGIAEDKVKDKIALACKDEVIVLANSTDLAMHYPNSPGKYDALYLPRATYHTGQLDIHDLNFGENDTLFGVNTSFSCIVKIDDNYNFTPYWKPPFIDSLVSEDRCHLNGMAMLNGKPKYATAFNQGNTHQSWRENVTKTGILIDVETNEIILENLAMPHSPRIFNGQLYVLLSATGELIRVNPETRTYEVVVKMDGFVRGMDLYKDYLFVGLSKLRKNSSTFAELDFAEAANEAAVMILHLPTGSIMGKLSYQSSLDEIYDVHILGDKIRPNVLNTIRPDYKAGLMIPEATFWSVLK
jgi:uncharacterized protein (TIGR03032 family)